MRRANPRIIDSGGNQVNDCAGPIRPRGAASAAGAKIFVAVEEIIRESHHAGHDDAASLCLMFGVAVMMTLDVPLG